MPRESSKCRKWEKERRDRLKEGFAELSKLLPCYDPSVNICKIDVLRKAGSLIQELQERVKKLLSSTESKDEKDDVLKKLHDRIKKLLSRNQQLVNFLQNAGITVPSIYGTCKKFRTPSSLPSKIQSDSSKIIRKRELDDVNTKKMEAKKKIKLKATSTSVAPKHRKVIINRADSKKIKAKRKSTIANSKIVPTSKCVIVFSHATVTQPCYIITNAPSNTMVKTTNSTVITNSTLLTTPLVSSNVKPYTSTVFTSTNPSISSLGPGTLILANGTILPVLQQPPNVLPTPTILNTFSQSKSTVIVVPNSSSNHKSVISNNIQEKKVATSSNGVKTLPRLKPKYCLTETTQVNKVPIPALTSRYANNYFVLNDNKNVTKTKKCTSKDVKIECKKKASAELKRNLEIEANSDAISEVTIKKNKIDENIKIIDSSLNQEVTMPVNTETDENAKTSNFVAEKKLETTLESEQFKNIVKIVPEEVVKENPITKTVLPVDRNKTIERELIKPNEPLNKSVCKEVNSELKVPCENEVPALLNPIEIKTSQATAQNAAITEEKKRLKEIEKPSIELVKLPTNAPAPEPTLVAPQVQEIKNLDLNLSHSELSNDIFASLQVPSGCQNPESTSPTAAFLLAFPLVSSLNGVKVTEVIDEDNSESQRGTPTLLQIGTMDTTKTTQSQTDSLASSFLNLDNFAFFSGKDVCGGFYNNYNAANTTVTTTLTTTTVTTNSSIMLTNRHSTIPKTVAAPANTGNFKSIYSEQKIKNPLKEIGCATVNNINYERKLEIPSINSLVPVSQNIHTHPIIQNVTNYQVKGKNIEPVQKNVDQKHNYLNQNKPYNPCNFNSINDTSKITTCSYVSVTKNYPTPLYTNSNNYSYGYHSETNFNQNYYKNIPKSDTRSYYPLNYENYSDYRKNDSSTHFSGNYYGSNAPQSYSKEKFNNDPISTAKVKHSTSQNKPPINWMTTPDNRTQTSSDYLLPPFTKETEFSHSTIYPSNSLASSSQTNYFNTTSMYTVDVGDINNTLSDSRKTLDLPLVPGNLHQKTDVEENQFSWSPTKIPQFLDPPHNFVSSTLPTLVGDLALGNPLGFGDQKSDIKCIKDNRKDNRRLKGNSYENQSNFLSVSQLVDHNKSDSIPARASTRRNSGNRSKVNSQKSKRVNKPHEVKEIAQSFNNSKIDKGQNKPLGNYNISGSNEMFCDQKTVPKNTPSSYSAESLIGHQMQPDKRQNYPNSNKALPVPSFLTDNLIPYFPPVDLQQENNYMQQNQNYQTNTFGHNFTTSFQNNAYTPNTFIPSVSTITTTYLSSNNFMHDVGSHDHMADNLNLFANTNKDAKHYNKNFNRQSNAIRDEKSLQNTNCVSNNFKKNKKKHSNEANLPGFEFPFLSMPGSINSPILPDDFHSHNSFLPPTTPYSCKNPLYPKQTTDLASTSLLPLPPVPGSRAGIQHPEISPSINTPGTSLTNFNLSAIFPEINKGHLQQDGYSESRHKEQTLSRSYPTTTSIQVPFGNVNKPTFSFIYNNQ